MYYIHLLLHHCYLLHIESNIIRLQRQYKSTLSNNYKNNNDLINPYHTTTFRVWSLGLLLLVWCSSSGRLIHAVACLHYDGKWLCLPLFGFLVGWLTTTFVATFELSNLWWCVDTIIFRFCFWYVKRKNCQIIYAGAKCEEVLTNTTEAIWHFILNGPDRINFQTLLRAYFIVFTEKAHWWNETICY